MALADELAYMTATDMATRIRRRQLSPVEVVDAVIERIEERNRSLNAFVFKGYDDARKRAEQAEHAVMAGHELGSLHGVPTAMKDLFDFKPGWPATFGGVRACKELVIDAYCTFAERIEKAGAILIGKTNSPIMGFRGVTDNYLFGPTGNPFDTDYNPGGSSGGSAAAVADGLVPFAEGTDGGGSIRIPAAWTGVYGYKASFGRVPMVMRPDAWAGTNPYIYEGPLTRTVEDAALVMNALSGYDPRDPYSLDEDVDFVPATRRSIKGMRIAYSPDLDVFPVDPRIAKVVGEAVEAFKEAGATVEEVTLGIERDQRELSDLWCRIIIPLSIAAFERMRKSGFDLLGEHRDDFPPEFLYWVDKEQGMTALELIALQEIRTEIYDAVQGVFADHDLLVCPTLTAMQVKNGTDGNTLGPAEVNGVEIDRCIGWCPTYVSNYSGHPAASIPAGFADGLPVGMQIMGRRYADVDVLAASAAFERLRPWHDSYARCAERALS